MPFRELNSVQLDTLKEVSNIGMGHAATALSQMIGQTVHLRVPQVTITPISQVPDHLGSSGYSVDFLDRRQFDKLLVGSWSREIQCADAFGDHVQGIPLFGVLLHEHQVQGIEHGTLHIPVKVVCHLVQGVAIGQ